MQLFFIPEISEKVFFLLSIFNFVAINLTIYWKFLFFKKNHFSNYSIFAIFSNLLETNWRRNWNFWESHIHAHTHTWETRLPFQSFFWVGSELTRSRGWKREFTFNSGRSRGRYAMTDCIPDDKFEATPNGRRGGPQGLAGTKRVACSGQRARFNIVYKLFHGDSHQHTNWFGEDLRPGLVFPSIPINHRSFFRSTGLLTDGQTKWKVTRKQYRWFHWLNYYIYLYSAEN